jgi:hypothetical protein
MRLLSELKIIARLVSIVCIPINVTQLCVAQKACVMHVIESVTCDKPNAFWLLILTFDTSAAAYRHTNFHS